jgi:hypothetical protein
MASMLYCVGFAAARRGSGLSIRFLPQNVLEDSYELLLTLLKPTEACHAATPRCNVKRRTIQGGKLRIDDPAGRTIGSRAAFVANSLSTAKEKRTMRMSDNEISGSGFIHPADGR